MNKEYQKYVRIDERGVAKAFFSEEFENVPEDAIKISYEIWEQWIRNTGGLRLEKGKLVENLPAVEIKPVVYKPTPLQFRRRLTFERLCELTLFASQQMDQGNSAIQVWLDNLNSAQEVDVSDASFRNGMKMLLALGKITQDEYDRLHRTDVPADELMLHEDEISVPTETVEPVEEPSTEESK